VEREERERRRDTFLLDAAAYAAVRPGYPEELLDAGVELAGLRPGARLLEVGCGPGQATEQLARRGHTILALDRSEAMVGYARARLAAFPHVEVRPQGFEQMHPEPSWDGLVFATSYHWLDPADRVERCASFLRNGGGLVLLWHTHPAPFTGFFERVQPLYRSLVPEWEPPPSPGMAEERILRICDELVRSSPEGPCSFWPPERRSHTWTRTFPRGEYLRLLCTYSDHILMPEATRAELLERIGRLIDEEFGGEVERPYRSELVVARRLAR